MRRINRCLRPVDSRPAGGWRPASDSIARSGGRSLAAVIIRRLNRFTIKVGFAQRYAEAREGVDQAIDWGCKPEPPKIPSPQLQSRQDGIQVDELSVAAEGIRVLGTSNRYSVNGILQSIFRSASRRETLGLHSTGGRRDGGLKMDWTTPRARAWPMCIDCRLDFG
jgi:hypothetical protein